MRRRVGTAALGSPAEVLIEFRTHGFSGTLDFGEPDAEGWMSCDVRIRVPGFETDYRCNVERANLEVLRDALARLNGAGRDVASLEWSAMERGIALRLELNRLGQVKGSYELRSDSSGPCLSGAFEADQTHLRQWQSDVERTLSQTAGR